MVFKYDEPIFSRSFLMCTSIVRSPTITSFPQIDSKIKSLLKTLSGFEAIKITIQILFLVMIFHFFQQRLYNLFYLLLDF